MNYYRQFFAYYKELENAFLDTENYVAIDALNYDTYSVKYSWLLQSICGEIDSVFKEIAKQSGDGACNNIKGYYVLVKDKMPTLVNNSLELVMREGEIKPFAGWTEQVRPNWWSVYNSIKHGRTALGKDGIENYKRASLVNTLNALGALYLLENYYIVFGENNADEAARKMLETKGRLFICTEWKNYYQSFMGQDLFPYKLFLEQLRGEGVKC